MSVTYVSLFITHVSPVPVTYVSLFITHVSLVPVTYVSLFMQPAGRDGPLAHRCRRRER